MSLLRSPRWLGSSLALAGVCLTAVSASAQMLGYRGTVTHNGLPVPGATVTLTQEGKSFTTSTDGLGIFTLRTLVAGPATIEIQMLGFATIRQPVTIAPDAVAAQFPLTLLTLAEIEAQPPARITPPKPPFDSSAASIAAGAAAEPADALALRAADGLLINGSVNNAATSQYALTRAFGNRRIGGRALYNGSLGATIDNSAFDARSYSFSGQDTPKPGYNRTTVVATFGGPIRIPHLLRHGPNFFVAYQWTRDRNATTESAIVPTVVQRAGDLSSTIDSSGTPVQVYDPSTGQRYTGNIPVSQQAAALLALYPLPNVATNSSYNYQVPILSSVHTDAMQSRADKNIGRKDSVNGGFSFARNRSSSANIFGFTDATRTLGLSTNVSWVHSFPRRLTLTSSYRFSRFSTSLVPYWQSRSDISAAAGITGNLQDPTYWGPPALTFSSGITPLTDGEPAFNRNRSDGVSVSAVWFRGRHNVTLGGDLHREDYNDLFQQDPRGTFQFTGSATASPTSNGTTATTGSDFADFLLGLPDTSSIAYGNADKYLRQTVTDLYLLDDWRVNPQLTVNAGVRWEYGAPITELKNRLVNLDIAPGFTAVAPVLASSPVGLLTGQHYPNSLIRPDKNMVEPRISLAWRPIPGSSMVVRAGYGVYADTSVYQSSALQLAQQSPLSKTLSISRSAACPITLASGFTNCSTTTANTFAVDPNFRVGYAQVWQLVVQRDLPGSLQLTTTYNGVKGTRGMQELLPNTYPVGAANPCPSCPLGFTYVTSNGNSAREAGQVNLRRRLHNGLTASLIYTYSKSIDNDASLGGQGASATSGSSGSSSASATSSTSSNPQIAQNWRNLRAERGLSNFDQRHLLTAQFQYTTGMGLAGGSLLTGRVATILREWTVLANINAGSGRPETPLYFVQVPGTAVAGTIRADYTGSRVRTGARLTPAGPFLNAAAFTAPIAGNWGTAGRNSLIGPSQFTLDASVSRTFRLTKRYNLDVRMDSTNSLNHASFTNWNSTINSSQFGLATAAVAMRSLEINTRLRF
jgi:hypothetical protein